MKKAELTAAVDAAKLETKNALHAIYDALNHVQQKKS